MTEAEKAICEAWAKAHAHKWQVLNRSQWKYQFREKTLVRFVEEVQCREDEMRLLLEWLTSADCVASLSAYDQSLSSAWCPVRAWYEITSKSVGSVHSVRLYHSLTTNLADGEDGPYVVENGCAWKVSWTYYWKMPSVQTVPASSSGVNYRITNISRDDETGLFTYALEKRERVQQTIPLYATGDTQFATTEEASYQGVRQNNVAGTGLQAGSGNGKVIRRKVTKNDDCTSNVANDVVTEKSVSSASVTTERHLGSQTVTRRDRSQVSQEPTAGLHPGESVTNEKTEGGRTNVVKVTTTPINEGAVSKRVSDTEFEHSSATQSLLSSNPGDPSVVSGGGVTKTKEVSRTAANGYQVNETTTTEKSVTNASVQVTANLTETVTTTTNRAMVEPAPVNDLEPGTSVENTKTAGGRWTQVIRSITAVAMKVLRVAYDRTIFARSKTSSTFFAEDPGMGDMSIAENGHIYSRSVTPRERGFVVDEKDEYEQPVLKSSRTTSQTPFECQVEFEDASTQTKSAADGTFKPSFRGRGVSHPSPDKDGNSNLIVTDTYSATPGGMSRRRKMFRFVKAVSWKTPLVSTNHRYHQQYHFRNFTKDQMTTLCNQCADHLNYLVNKWVRDGRPPSSYDVSPSASVNNDGFYDGSVSYGASWANDMAGQNGEINCVIEKTVYTRYDLAGKEYNANFDGSQTWTGRYLAWRRKIYRISGRGRSLYESLVMDNNFISPFNCSYNTETCRWVIEATLLNEFIAIPADLMIAGTRSVFDRIQVGQITPSEGRSAEPDISGTEF